MDNNKPFSLIALFFCLLFPNFTYSQGEWNNWIFGQHAGITFNFGSPFPITTVSPLYNGRCSNVTVSDSLGNLLFYVENNQNMSEYVYNRNNVRTPNGNLFNGNSQNNPQPFYVVQNLTDDSTYYIFSMIDPSSSGSGGLFYSILDMRLDGGLGDIVVGQKSLPILSGSHTASVLTGTRHNNNKDAWIVVHNHTNSNSYLSYLINLYGIDTTPIISPSLIYPVDSNFMRLNTIKISPDGTKLICLADSNAEYCSFNSTTGVITPLFKIKCNANQTFWYDDAEFSVDNKYLYVTEGGEPSNGATKLYQFDATKTDSTGFKQSQILISSEPYSWGHQFAGLQRGPDYKIYSSDKYLNDSIGVINNPSLQGIACNYQENAVCLLPSNTAWWGFPQFLQKYKAYIHHNGNCQNNPVHIYGDIWPLPDSVHWDFGDPASGLANFSNLQYTSHVYSNIGIYTIELFVRHTDKRTDTSWQTITIVSSPQVTLGPDRTICTGDSTTFDAGLCSGCTYLWKDLGSGLQVGTTQTFRTGQPGTYAGIVTNSNGCTGSDTVQLINTPVPSVTNNPLSKSICTGESTNIPLTSNITGATFHWIAGLTAGNVTGYSPDSGLIINQVLINSLPTPGIVTYHITPKVGSCMGTTVDFPVTVNAGDSVKVSISASVNNVCAGTPVTYTAIPTNGGTNPFYQWKVNGNNVGANSTIYTYNPVSGDMVSCVLTSSNTICISNNPATSNTIQMIVNPLNPVSIAISPSANPVCAGTSVTFLANPTNPGTSPVYQWKVNGINVGISSTSYTYTPLNGDQVICILTSNATCVTGNPSTSNQVIMIVNPNLLVNVTIAASANPVCSGIPVTFTASNVNGGVLPFYQWRVNGINVGTNLSAYTYTPLNGDIVSCVLTSGLPCTSNNPATSNSITMSIGALPVVTFTLCNDSITTTNAKPFKLKGGIPLGGTYSGAGVAGGIFNPSVAGAGTHQITYSYTNAALCSASAQSSVHSLQSAVFSCGNNLVDIRDNKTYATTQIGSQCWFAEDLNYGTEIPSNMHQRDNCIAEKYHNPASGIGHPASVYQWDEIMNYDEVVSTQGLCPPGWHVPSEADWNILFANYTNNAFSASPLKYSGFSGFDALLSGVNHMNRSWDYHGFATFFWSSTSHGTTKAWAHGMNDLDPSVSAYPSFRNNGFSVRCLKD